MCQARNSEEDSGVSETCGSYPSTGIDVLIVGTGLAGLIVAIERHWPELKEEYWRIPLHNAWIETFKYSGEVILLPTKVVGRLRAWGLNPGTPPSEFQMRPLVYEIFVHRVEKFAISIELSSRVVDYSEDEIAGRGGCTTEDRKRYEADTVIAADDVGSKLQKLVGRRVRAEPSGRAMWRAAFLRKVFRMVPGNESIVRTWLGPSTYAFTLTREDVMVWIMNHDVTGSEKESWNHTIDNDEELVKCSPPNTVVNFESLWRNSQPSWTSPGAHVGDPAHSCPRASGNGATEAIKYTISIASCLQISGKENISQSLLQDTDWDKVILDSRRAAPKLPKWVWSQNREAYAYENYFKAGESMKKEYRYESWSIEKIMEGMRKGMPIDLGLGYWE
ncbi:hypothetical protein K469DRAFT_737428 [Zopfia rhizophila CBS 207.26]|uniref:FAD/NAD(P)-binding domain-containing protein n=1 Tax=Zopfia rhizophila CBS 207.26 TaxID=1314779 RepID=A0A6A6EDL4_9PEZI|nr:hypothetical protein K469DRAFT_737428 [Zopfia rhizophila CBS 207.26]